MHKTTISNSCNNLLYFSNHPTKRKAIKIYQASSAFPKMWLCKFGFFVTKLIDPFATHPSVYLWGKVVWQTMAADLSLTFESCSRSNQWKRNQAWTIYFAGGVSYATNSRKFFKKSEFPPWFLIRTPLRSSNGLILNDFVYFSGVLCPP